MRLVMWLGHVDGVYIGAVSSQAVASELFRQGVLELCAGRCALTGLAMPELLRARHIIKSWSVCDDDAERLDVFNGLPLAPHLDALFDRGFITFEEDGRVSMSDARDDAARKALGLTPDLAVRTLRPRHRPYLAWHRQHLFAVADHVGVTRRAGLAS